MADDLINPPAPAPTETEIVRARQKSRAVIMGVLLGLFVVLIFAISIVKMQMAHPG